MTGFPGRTSFCGCFKDQTVFEFSQFVLKLILNFYDASNQKVLRCHCLFCEAIVERAETKRNISTTKHRFKEIIICENNKKEHIIVWHTTDCKLLTGGGPVQTNQRLRPPSAHMASHLANHSSMVTRVTIVLCQASALLVGQPPHLHERLE